MHAACPPSDAHRRRSTSLRRRLLDGPGEHFDVQFATGLLWRGPDLLISYGLSDCFSALAVLRDARTKLQLWEARGIGSQTEGAAFYDAAVAAARALLPQAR